MASRNQRLRTGNLLLAMAWVGWLSAGGCAWLSAEGNKRLAIRPSLAAALTKMTGKDPSSGRDPKNNREIALVSHEKDGDDPLPQRAPTPPPDIKGPDYVVLDYEEVESLENLGLNETDQFVIDVATALRLGGANALQVELARERTYEAQIAWKQARIMILPSLVGGIGWTRHDGRIQSTPGPVIDADRNSLFLGGGAGLKGMPLTGGAGGPARLVVNLSLADAHFEPLAKRQLL
ncbi:MAG: hypothetical protein N2C12_01085, partial [Planctomycetales bacterium]